MLLIHVIEIASQKDLILFTYFCDIGEIILWFDVKGIWVREQKMG